MKSNIGNIEDLYPNLRTPKKTPSSLQNNSALLLEISKLPYNFELTKTISLIHSSSKPKRIALQFPEGLLIFACKITTILRKFCPFVEDFVILGDITYGGCCIDDEACSLMNCDLLLHYGHSCLIPVHHCCIKIMYIFVEIKVNFKHVLETLVKNFYGEGKGFEFKNLILFSTIQFNGCLERIKMDLTKFNENNEKKTEIKIEIPQIMPLSKGEILGCTSPKLSMFKKEESVILYVGDGRFHIESIMIQNPGFKCYKYDPYVKKLSIEYFDQNKMLEIRKRSVKESRESDYFGIILSTLGRQGNIELFRRIENLLIRKKKKYIILLLDEIYPSKLDLFEQVDSWIQIACPRLSIDWGSSFSKPILNPYEIFVLLDEKVEWNKDSTYPMTNYSIEPFDDWSNSYIKKRSKVKLSIEERRERKRLFRERLKKLKGEKENEKNIVQ